MAQKHSALPAAIAPAQPWPAECTAFLADRPVGTWRRVDPEVIEARERARAIRCGDVRREMFHDLKPVYRWRWL